MDINFNIQRDSLPEEEWTYKNVEWSGFQNNDNLQNCLWLTLKSLSDEKAIYIPMAWVKKIQVNP